MSEPQESVQVDQGPGHASESKPVGPARLEAPVPPVKPERHPRREGWIRCANGC